MTDREFINDLLKSIPGFLQFFAIVMGGMLALLLLIIGAVALLLRMFA